METTIVCWGYRESYRDRVPLDLGEWLDTVVKPQRLQVFRGGVGQSRTPVSSMSLLGRGRILGWVVVPPNPYKKSLSLNPKFELGIRNHFHRYFPDENTHHALLSGKT